MQYSRCGITQKCNIRMIQQYDPCVLYFNSSGPTAEQCLDKLEVVLERLDRERPKSRLGSDINMLMKESYANQLATHNQHKGAETEQVTQDIAWCVELQGALGVTGNGLHDNDTMIKLLQT